MIAARTALLLAAGLALNASALSQSYPGKPVRVIIPNVPGSGLDIVGRAVSQKLSEIWGQPVVVDNRPGGGGTVGTGTVARAAPDGYTLLVAASNHALNPALYNRLYFGRNGKCLVRYDNEAGKGDHRHIKGRETSYKFVSVGKLRQDFEADVRRYGNGDEKKD